MQIKTSVYIATSVDGYIARADGALDWLTSGNTDPSTDYGYDDFISTVDVLVMGRNTFETVLGFGQWPYRQDVYVLTRHPGQIVIPDDLSPNVKPVNTQPVDLLRGLYESGYRHAYVDGGQTIQSFLTVGVIDELTITRVPVLLGTGIPLFGSLSKDIRLDHVETLSYESGFVQSRYRIRH